MDEQINQIKRELQAAKTVLTKLLNKLASDEISLSILQSLNSDAIQRFENIKAKQNTLITLVDDSENENMATRIVDYEFEIQTKISAINDRIKLQLEVPHAAETETDNSTFGQGIFLKMPEIKLPKFNDNSSNLFNYINFRSAFLNGISAAPEMSESTKFMYLRSQVSGKAYNLVENLSIDETTFGVALAALDKEFLNRQEIFTATMGTFMDQPPANNLETACQVVLNFKTNLIELRKINYSFDEGEATSELISMILRKKLPNFFTIEIARSCGNSNPSYSNIFDNYQAVRRMLTDNKRAASKTTDAERAPPTQYKKQPDINRSQKNVPERKNSNVDGKALKPCKFCLVTDHRSISCNKYRTVEQRTNRAQALKLCVRCLSPRHTAESCFGVRDKLPFACNECGSHSHVTPVCKGYKPTRIVNATTD